MASGRFASVVFSDHGLADFAELLFWRYNEYASNQLPFRTQRQDGGMITFHTFADIPENRRVMVVLPPETPVGKAELTVTIATPSAGEEHAAPPQGDLRSLFGSVRSGDPRSGDNERIDADLARAYDNLQD
jgi:hypothetical protein